MNRQCKKVLVSLVPTAFACAAFAQGTIQVFNSFGPGNSYNGQGGWVVAGSDGIPGGTGYLGVAEYFAPNTSGYLNQIELATFFMSGSTVSDFSIAQDSGSGVPGPLLENFTNVPTPDGVLTINSVIKPFLQAGQTYWLCDQPAYPNTGTLWCLNSQGVENNFAMETSEGNWYPASPDGAADAVFSIAVVPTPEPSAIALLACGPSLLLMVKKTKKEVRPRVAFGPKLTMTSREPLLGWRAKKDYKIAPLLLSK